MHRPPPLRPAAVIGIIAPSSPVKDDLLIRGRQYLSQAGYHTVVGDSIAERQHHLAGTDEQRLADIYRMFNDSGVDAVFAARGGFGCAKLLDRLDYTVFSGQPKLLVGYSDITALQLALWQHSRLPTISGPMVAVEMARPGMINEPLFWGLLGGVPLAETSAMMSRYLNEWVAFDRPQPIKGRLLGGTLSVIASLAGSRFLPDFSNAVLILEEHGERLYRLDRYLTQLRLAGVFAKVSMVILGQMLLPDQEEQPLLAPFLRNFFANDHFPVVYNFRYGHCSNSFIFPQGATASIDLPACRITLLDHCVSLAS